MDMRRISFLFVMLLALGLLPALSMAAQSAQSDSAGTPAAVAPVRAPKATAQLPAAQAPAPKERASTVEARGLYFAAFGSWNSYGMKNANEFVDEFNLELAGQASMPKIRSDYGLGLHFGTDRRHLALGLGYERFFASSDVTYGGTWGAIRMKLPANAFYALTEFRLKPLGAMRTRLGLAAGAVTLAPVSQFALKFGTRSYAIPMTGGGPLFQGWLTEEWAGPGFDVFASGGYRYAKVEHPKVTDTANLSGFPVFPIDYSGATARVGFKVHLRK
jgi:hypothetical protein